MAYYPRVFYYPEDEGGGPDPALAAAIAQGQTTEEVEALTQAYKDRAKAEAEAQAARLAGNERLARSIEEQNEQARIAAGISEDQLRLMEQRIAAQEQLAESERQANEEIEEAAELELQFLGYANQAVEAIKKQVIALQDTRKVLGQNTGLFGQFNQQLTDSVSTAARFGKDQKAVSGAIASLSGNMMNFTQISGASQKTLIDGSLALKQFGIDAEVSAKANDFLMNSLGKSAEEAVGYQKDLVELGHEIGMSGKGLVKAFGTMSGDLAKFGDNAGDVFKNLAKTAKATGVEMSELLAIASKFDTFEGAASAVGKLNAQMGTNLDAMSLMQEEDPAKQVEMLRDAFLATGKDLSSMSKFEKMAAADAMGMKLPELQKFLAPKEEVSETDKDFDELMEMTMTFGEKLSAVGKQLAAFFTPVISILADLLDFISPVISAVGDLVQWLAEKKAVVYSLATVIGAALVPVLYQAAAATWGFIWAQVKLVAGIVKWIAVNAYQNAAWVVNKIQIAATTVAQWAMTAAVGAYNLVAGIATAATWLFNAALLANPIGLVIVGVTALVAALYLLWENMGEIGSFFGDMWDGIAAKFDWLISKVVNGAEVVRNSVSGVLCSEPAAEETPALAEGTPNFKGGTALVGEKGPEMVNLPKGAEVIPNNKLQSAEKSASTTKAAGEEKPPIIKLILNERELGEAVLDVINKKLDVFSAFS